MSPPSPLRALQSPPEQCDTLKAPDMWQGKSIARFFDVLEWVGVSDRGAEKLQLMCGRLEKGRYSKAATLGRPSG